MEQLRERYPDAPKVLLDTGNFSDSPGTTGDIKTRALLEGMQRLGYSVINVGERDLRMGWETFRKRTEDSPLTFISANFVKQGTTEPIFPPHEVIELTGGDGKSKLRLGIIGIARYNPLFLKDGPGGSKISIVHPLDRVKHEVAELANDHLDAIVLLAALHKDDAVRIAAEVPEIDFVLGAYGGLISSKPEPSLDAAIAYSGNKGQRIGEMRVFMDEAGEITDKMTRMHFLTAAYPADEKMPVGTTSTSPPARSKPQSAQRRTMPLNCWATFSGPRWAIEI